MAIAYDASSQAHDWSAAGSSITWAHTCTGSNRILIVGVVNNQLGLPTGVTYNGVSLTNITGANVSTGSVGQCSLWYLVAPATGANNVVVTFSGVVNAFSCVAASYTGVLQTGVPDASSTNTLTGPATFSTTLTTIADNCWTLGVWSNNQADTITGGASTTVRQSIPGGNVPVALVDSNAVITPAGSNTLTSGNSSSNWLGGMISLAQSRTDYARTMSDAIFIGASRTISNSRVASFFRTASDSISNAASRLATISKGFSRTMSDSVMNAASRFAILTGIPHFATHFVATMSDSMMVARGRLTTTKAYVNGLLVQFVSKFTPQGTSYSDKYTPQGTPFENKY